jgi:hypothetical protein
VVETLSAIRARAIETGRPEWIREQSAAALADLDRAQWDRIIRVIASFGPVDADRHELPDTERDDGADS